MLATDGGAIYGRGTREGDKNEHTAAIQYAQSLWLSRCSLCVGHSKSKLSASEETVLGKRAVESKEVVCCVVVGSLCLDARRCTYNVDLTIEGLFRL